MVRRHLNIMLETPQNFVHHRSSATNASSLGCQTHEQNTTTSYGHITYDSEQWHTTTYCLSVSLLSSVSVCFLFVPVSLVGLSVWMGWRWLLLVGGRGSLVLGFAACACVLSCLVLSCLVLSCVVLCCVCVLCCCVVLSCVVLCCVVLCCVVMFCCRLCWFVITAAWKKAGLVAYFVGLCAKGNG